MQLDVAKMLFAGNCGFTWDSYAVFHQPFLTVLPNVKTRPVKQDYSVRWWSAVHYTRSYQWWLLPIDPALPLLCRRRRHTERE
jgi:hypothetical protein